MAVQMGSKGQAGFGEPLELMKDCHRRIEGFLDVLVKVAAGNGVLDAERRRALEAALTYFREAAPRHTEDEDVSLFPRLKKCGGPEVAAAMGRVEQLEKDHVRATGLHEAIEAAGEEWLMTGNLEDDALLAFRRQLEELRDLYQRHIKMEDEEIFPLAGKVLQPGALKEVGEEMKNRRGKTKC